MNKVSVNNYYELIQDLSEDETFILEWFRKHKNEKFTVKEALFYLNKYYPERGYDLSYVKPRISKLSKEKEFLKPAGEHVFRSTKRGKERTISENYYQFNKFLIDPDPTLF
ncbi:MAG: hypothetical protein KKH44_07745 [Bacteroidetes bacterium]|nr:hypothetical protein [Bacteroidota bacterium]